MQTLTWVINQRDKAARHIDTSRLEHLRLALLLLTTPPSQGWTGAVVKSVSLEDLRERIRAQTITTGAVD